MQTPSCTSYQLGSITTTRFTRTRHSDIVHPVSSSQLTEARDRVRSFGGYNSARAPPRSSTKHRHYVFRHVDHPRYCEPCGHHRIVGGSHPATRAPKLKKKFLKRLLHSEPITPKHQPAKTIGGQFGSHVSEEVRAFFADFADFANVVNWWLADEHVDSRWRLQELPETELSLHGVFDCGPIFGRSYAVFYNQVRIGELELHPFLYSTERPKLIRASRP